MRIPLIVSALAVTVPVANVQAQRVEAGGVIAIVFTADNEGSFAVGGRVSVPLRGALAAEGEVTYGMPLGDGDSGDVLGTLGLRAMKKFGPAGAFLTVRPGFLNCGNDCALTDRPGTSGVVYAGGGIKLGGKHAFFRADVGAYAVRQRGKPAFGFELGVQF